MGMEGGRVCLEPANSFNIGVGSSTKFNDSIYISNTMYCWHFFAYDMPSGVTTPMGDWCTEAANDFEAEQARIAHAAVVRQAATAQNIPWTEIRSELYQQPQHSPSS